jgi:diacylglycerol kinase family enzyme
LASISQPKIPLVYNAKSGPYWKDPDAILASMDAGLRARVEPIEMSFPFDYSESIEKAQHAGGPLVVWGGDGTIHYAAKALLEKGCPAPLAALPGGSGNGLAGGLRTPENPIGALENLLSGREMMMDVGRLDGEPFFNVAGCGFEGDLAHEFDESGGMRGFFNYAKIALKLWRSSEPLNAQWEAVGLAPNEPRTGLEKLKAAWYGPGPDFPGIAWSLCFANLPQYGNGLWIAPGADPTDGAIQWVTLAKPSIFDFVAELPQLFKENGRTKLRREGQIKSAAVHFDFSVNWQIDGEPAQPRDRAEITIEPRVFRMMVIRGCPWS